MWGSESGPPLGLGFRTKSCRHAGGAWAAKMRLCVELCSKRAPLGTTVWTVSVCMCVDSFWYGIRTPKLTPKAARLSPHAAPMPSASGTYGCRNGDTTMPQNGPVHVATASRPGATSAPRKQRTRRDLTQAHGAQSAADGESLDRVKEYIRNSKLLTVAPRFAGHFPNPKPYPHST